MLTFPLSEPKGSAVPLRTRSIPNQDAALRELAKLVQQGMEDPRVRATALKIVSKCPARDDLCELQAIYDAVKHGTPEVRALSGGFPYRADPKTLDWFQSAGRSLKMCEHGACGGDCLPLDTLVLRRDYRLVPIGDLAEGDIIMADGQWTRVIRYLDKGIQPLLAFDLSNGSTLRCTPEHRLFRVPPGADRSAAEEVRASDVRPDDDLLTALRLPAGAESMDPDRAWLLGVYIADGWVDGKLKDAPCRFCISGRDGKKKEAQKDRVVELCEKWGLDHRGHDRYVAVNDPELARFFASTGRRAPQKHVPSGLNYDLPTIAALLEGLRADSCETSSLVHGTTSPLLALQLRVMYRMQGLSTHIRRVDEHGGLGENPIYRVTVRKPETIRRDVVFARVRAIRAGAPEPTCDIETDVHSFYLPETDLVVHNCDDHTTLVASLAGSLGFTPGLRAYGKPHEAGYSHIYPVVLLPKKAEVYAGFDGLADFTHGAEVIGMDTTVPNAYLGWQPPRGRYRDAWITD